MPGLMAVSDSDDEEELDEYRLTESSDDADEDDSDEDDDEGDDGTDDEDFKIEIGKQYRRAMDIYNEVPDMFDNPPSPNDKYAHERKSNPFLMLLGKLRGLMIADFVYRFWGSIKTTQAACSLRPRRCERMERRH